MTYDAETPEVPRHYAETDPCSPADRAWAEPTGKAGKTEHSDLGTVSALRRPEPAPARRIRRAFFLTFPVTQVTPFVDLARRRPSTRAK
jgi:hypothetical protein